MKARYIIIEDEYWELKGLASRIRRILPEFELLGTAMNGAEGLELAIRTKPDIALTDIRMPQMNGLEFAKQLLLTSPECAVIILSGFSEFEYARRALSYGVSGYLLKPVEDEELSRELLAAACAGKLQRGIHPAISREGLEPPVQQAMIRVRDYVLENYAQGISVKTIADLFNMDVSNLSKQYKRMFDVNLSDYIGATRLDAARRLIISTDLPSAQIGVLTGFPDASYFYRAFKKAFGVPPGEYRMAANYKEGKA